MLKGSRAMQISRSEGGTMASQMSEVVAKGDRQSDGCGRWKLNSLAFEAMFERD